MGADAVGSNPVHSERRNWLDWKEERCIIYVDGKRTERRVRYLTGLP